MKQVRRAYHKRDTGGFGIMRCEKRVGGLRRLGLLMIFAIASWVSPCRAQDEEAARARFKRGVELFQAEDYEGALEAFEESYEILPRASTLFNAGMCQKALTQNLAAIATFERFLSERAPGDDPVMREDAEAALVELDQKVGKLGLEGAPESAVVIVDGREAAETPLARPLLVNPGQHAVRVSRQGFEPFEITVMVEAGAQVTLAAALEPIKAEAPVAPEQPSPSDDGQPSVQEPVEDSGPVSPLLVSGIVAAGLGLVGAGVGVYYTVEYNLDWSDGEAAADAYEGEDVTIEEENYYKKVYDDISQNQLPADKKGMIAGYVVGGALLAAGAVMIIVDLTRDEEPPETSRVSVYPGGVVVGF